MMFKWKTKYWLKNTARNYFSKAQNPIPHFIMFSSLFYMETQQVVSFHLIPTSRHLVGADCSLSGPPVSSAVLWFLPLVNSKKMCTIWLIDYFSSIKEKVKRDEAAGFTCLLPSFL